MAAMTTKERVLRMFEHKEADRIPITDEPWGSTIERWKKEGMPADMNFKDYFDIDHVESFWVDSTPQYEEKTLEETDEYRLYTTKWGATLKSWTHATSTPEFVDFTITTPDAWQAAKKRMVPSDDRINWKKLDADYKAWRKNGAWVLGKMFFGFDVLHSWVVGTERVLMGMVTDPEWITDMIGHMLEMNIALYERVWARGYEFDSIFWYDDMGYKGTQFFSVDMYRDLIKPFHKKAIDWAHSKGIKAHLHSCGDINPLVPELIDLGLDALNPLEVKAGMDAIHLKKTYGDKLTFHGGINAVLWDKPEQIRAEMEEKLPVLKENGGYIFSSDHSVPDNISLEDFRGIIEHAKKLGSY